MKRRVMYTCAALLALGTFITGCSNGSDDDDEVDVTLAAISVASDAATTLYEEGSAFSTAGLAITAEYSDKSTTTVQPSLATFAIGETALTEGATLPTGKHQVTVAYAKKTDTYAITVLNFKVTGVKGFSLPPMDLADDWRSGIKVTSNGTDVTSNATIVLISAGTEVTVGERIKSDATYTLSVIYDEAGNGGTISFPVAISDPLPFTVAGVIAKDTVVPALAVTEDTGVSISFWLGNDYVDDFTDVISTTQAWIRLATLGSIHDGTWIGNIFEAATTVGSDFSAAYHSGTGSTAHLIFLNEAAYVTISFDGSTVKFYKNGKLALTYAADVTGWDFEKVLTNTVSVADFSSDVIEDIATSGMKLNPGDVTMANVTINTAVTDESAAAAYTDALATISAITVTPSPVEFIVGDDFSFDGAITVTAAGTTDIAIDKSMVTFDTPDMNTNQDAATVTVTAGSASTSYTVTILDEGSIIVPVAAYYNALKETGTDLTIVGSGSFVDDSTFGTVFKNVSAATTRSAYLKLPENLFVVSGGNSIDGMTIGFWVNANSDTSPWYPLFMCYGAEPTALTTGTTYAENVNVTQNTYPMFTIESRCLPQINNAGYCDFAEAQQTYKHSGWDATWNMAYNAYKDGNWHYFTCTLTETTLNIYVDGVLISTWTVDGTSNGQVIKGLFTNGANLKVNCLGGNQNWAWNDKDAPYSFAKFSLWHSALSATQISKIVSDTKNSNVDSFAPTSVGSN